MTETEPAAHSEIDRICNRLVTDLVALSPIWGTYLGRGDRNDQLDDLSPDGHAARHELTLRAERDLAAADAGGAQDDATRLIVGERLGVWREKYESGWDQANLNVIESPLQHVRMVFDVMPTESDEDWAAIARRMRAVPDAMAGYRQSLLESARAGRTAARRQIERCARQARTFAGSTTGRAAGSATGSGFFQTLAGRYGTDPGSASAGSASAGSASSMDPVAVDLRAAAVAADSAYGDFARFLSEELLPHGAAADGVGAERYALCSREHLGAAVDLAETYDWGWQEFLAIEAEMRQVAERIGAGRNPAEAADLLDEDPRYRLVGQDGLVDWLQRTVDTVIADLAGSHFEIDPAIRTLECRIAVEGTSLGAYYLGPSDDLQRPGRMYWSVPGDQRTFARWRETTTMYHEGVPGHHLQVATAVAQKDQLNDFRRMLSDTAGHGEGWALYAERLVRELGYLDDDGDLLGMLDGQLFRAARVVVDLGLHLGLTIPAGTGFHQGERWTPDLAIEFLDTRTLLDRAAIRDEVERYLGWPGQAPAYKVGERVWLAEREAARLRHPDTFDLKAFHTAALTMGGMGLDPLHRLLLSRV